MNRLRQILAAPAALLLVATGLLAENKGSTGTLPAEVVPPEEQGATVLLITHDTLAEAWKPFATWKTQNGKPTRMVTMSTIAEEYEKVTLEDVSRLENSPSPLIMTTVSCFTGQFDDRTDPCIAEAMLRHPDGGAVVVVAPSREGVPVFHDPARDYPLMMSEGKMDGTTATATLFWKYALEPDRTVGEAFAMAKADLTADAKRTPGYHFVQCEVNLLGDPTLTLGR